MILYCRSDYSIKSYHTLLIHTYSIIGNDSRLPWLLCHFNMESYFFNFNEFNVYNWNECSNYVFLYKDETVIELRAKYL